MQNCLRWTDIDLLNRCLSQRLHRKQPLSCYIFMSHNIKVTSKSINSLSNHYREPWHLTHNIVYPTMKCHSTMAVALNTRAVFNTNIRGTAQKGALKVICFKLSQTSIIKRIQMSSKRKKTLTKNKQKNTKVSC